MSVRNRYQRIRPSSHLARQEQLEPRLALALSYSLTGPTQPVTEGNAASFAVRLSESSNLPQSITVVTQPITATGDFNVSPVQFSERDFVPAVVRLYFEPGEVIKTFQIQTLRDTGNARLEGIETFRVVATGGGPLNFSRTATVQIKDGPPTVSVANTSVREGAKGSMSSLNFAVSLSYPAAMPVTVAYTTRDGSATVGDKDFRSASGGITFAPGETSKIVSVPVIGDDTLEADETMTLLLSNATNASILRSTATGTIVNDEWDKPGFQIDVIFATDVPLKVRGALSDAVSTWQRLISGDIPAVISPFTGLPVDDIQLLVINGLWGVQGGTDGVGEGIAIGGPHFMGEPALRSDLFLPFHGTIGFDPADAARESYLNLYTAAMHEIAHALGFSFDTAMSLNLLALSSEGIPMFIGKNAVREFNSTFRITGGGVPISEDFEQELHWDEYVFQRELMTPALARGMTNPLSRMTAGFFEDIGYQVRYAFADPYSRNSAVSFNPLLLQLAVDFVTSSPPARARPR